MNENGVRAAVAVCVLVGAVNALLGLVVLAGLLDGLFAADLLRRSSGYLALAEGLLALGLAYGTSRGSALCAFVAAAGYTLTTALVAWSGLSGALPLRLTFALVLWRGALHLWASKTASPQAAALPPAPPARRRSATRHPPSAGGARRRRRPPRHERALCPNCRDSFPRERRHCPLCSVALVEL